ncbi:MAG TPA: FliG C-terminal domain-containing protein [Rhodoblastus sp.]|nr:FliG C-terminal domain-containing protein [Rhodoblastus sp.]
MSEIERRRGGDRRRLTGAQRVAALLIVLGKDGAARVLQHLSKEDVLEIAKSAATLGIVDRTALDGMVDQFSADFVEGPELIGTLAEAQQLVAGTLAPQEVADIAPSNEQDAPIDVWLELQSRSNERITGLLQREPPWLAAPIVAGLNSDRASGVLANLDDEMRRETVGCMLTCRRTTPFILRLLEEALASVLANDDPSSATDDGQRRVAEIVNLMPGDVMEDVMSHLSSIAPDQANGVRSLIFRFEELPLLAPEHRAALFDGLPAEKVILALKGAAPDLVEAALSSLGARARRMVENELSADAGAPDREINAARQYVVATVLRLSQSGTIRLPSATLS